MITELKQKLCKHLNYDIIECKKENKYYVCKCTKCGYIFDLPKAVGEIYSNKKSSN